MESRIRNWTPRAVLVLAVAAPSLFGCQYATGDDDPSTVPTLDVPTEVAVQADAVGEEGREVFRIRNRGDALLRVSDLAVVGDSPFEITYPTGAPDRYTRDVEHDGFPSGP